jgi:cell division protein FtsB
VDSEGLRAFDLNSRDSKTINSRPPAGSAAIGRKAARELPDASCEADDKFSALWRQYGRGALGLLILVLLVHDIFGTHGFLTMRRTQAEITAVKANLVRLDAENDQLAGYVHDLKSDPRTIEKLAREGSLLAKPGEVIIKIPQAQWLGQDPPEKP